MRKVEGGGKTLRVAEKIKGLRCGREGGRKKLPTRLLALNVGPIRERTLGGKKTQLGTEKKD